MNQLLTNSQSSCFLVLLHLLLSSSASAQQYAEFSTDTSFFSRWTQQGKSIPDRVIKQSWTINGQKMSYGSGTLKVEVNPQKMDTIIFKDFRRKKSDTILCNVAKVGKYKFYYNECCGAFNLKDEAKKQYVSAKVKFKLRRPNKKTYLGSLGEAAVLLNKNTALLTPNCRSAMSSNVYKITIREIKYCDDDNICEEWTCLQKGAELDESFYFDTFAEKKKFLYLPLSDAPLEILYYPRKNKMKIMTK